MSKENKEVKIKESLLVKANGNYLPFHKSVIYKAKELGCARKIKNDKYGAYRLDFEKYAKEIYRSEKIKKYDGSTPLLKPNMEKFCRYFIRIEETRNSAGRSYAFAYDKDLENLSREREKTKKG